MKAPDSKDGDAAPCGGEHRQKGTFQRSGIGLLRDIQRTLPNSPALRMNRPTIVSQHGGPTGHSEVVASSSARVRRRERDS